MVDCMYVCMYTQLVLYKKQERTGKSSCTGPNEFILSGGDCACALPVYALQAKF